MPEDLIRYDVLAQEALRGVVRKVLQEVSRTGLPGEHHFFISFDTKNPGVRMSTRLRSLYPDEMTIVLQHQFWDLNLTDTGIEVGLSFNGIPERLQVPYRAITSFVDPHASFGLKFDTGEASGAGIDVAESADAQTAADDDREGDTANTPEDRRLALAGDLTGNEPFAAGNDDEIVDPEEQPGDPAGEQPGEPGEETADGEADRPEEGAEVVSLDAFRKKNG